MCEGSAKKPTDQNHLAMHPKLKHLQQPRNAIAASFKTGLDLNCVFSFLFSFCALFFESIALYTWRTA